MEKMSEIIEKLSPLERKIIPFLNLDIEGIKKKAGLDEVSVLRALRFLENKGLLKLNVIEKKIASLY